MFRSCYKSSSGYRAGVEKELFGDKNGTRRQVVCRDCVVYHPAKLSNTTKQLLEFFRLEQDYPGGAVGVDICTLPWGDGE